jgi:NADH-quinone oxidoreductase subunit M
VVAGLSIILAAIYTLNMIQKVFYGNTSSLTENTSDIPMNVKFALVMIIFLIFIGGIYPKPMLSVTSELSDAILSRMNLRY